MKPILLTLFLLLFFVSAADAQQIDDPRYYDIGSPTLKKSSCTNLCIA